MVVKSGSYVYKEKISEIEGKMELYEFVICHQSFVLNLCEAEKIVIQKLFRDNAKKLSIWLYVICTVFWHTHC